MNTCTCIVFHTHTEAEQKKAEQTALDFVRLGFGAEVSLPLTQSMSTLPYDAIRFF